MRRVITLSVMSLVLSGCVGLGTSLTKDTAGNPVPDPADFPKIATVDPRFQSYNVEMAEIVGGRFWAPYPKPGETALPVNTQASGGLALEAQLFRQRPPADLTHPRLRAMAKGLGPAYIRVSGSWANTTYFQDNDLPPLTTPPKGFQNILTRSQWAGVLDFAKAVDGALTLSFAASPGARDANGVWSPEQARALLAFTRSRGGHIVAAELINEPNLGAVSGLPSGYDAALFARDSAAFRTFVSAEAPEMKIIGPGSTGETGVPLFSGKGISSEALLTTEPRARFDIFSYHFYGGRSQRCAKMAPTSGTSIEAALGEEWLGRTDTALAFYKDLRDRHAPDAPIWLNETAQASCGGDRWASAFADSFRYLDQMGRLAKQGVSAVFHNTLAASDYGLIDEATLTPRPNYWSALLWRRLMGPGVLDTGTATPGLHLYAHCLRDTPGGVALLAMALDRNAPATLTLKQPGQLYRLTADTLDSETVKLNGRALSMVGDSLPELQAQTVAAGAITLPPASISFIALPKAGHKACR